MSSECKKIITTIVVYCLTRTCLMLLLSWLKPSVTNAEVNITNFSFARQDRKDKIGEGAVIYVGNGLPYRLRTDLQKNDIETCWIQIIGPNTKSPFVCSVYRSPDANLGNFIENLNNATSIIQENAELILLGDFNVDYKHRKIRLACIQPLPAPALTIL